MRNLEKTKPNGSEKFSSKAPKLLILNFPNNPTGQIPDREYLKELSVFLEKENFIVLSDEIYTQLEFDTSDCFSMAQFLPNRTVLLGGISKWAGSGGWRLGYAAIPSIIKDFIPSINSVLSETISCAATPIQMAARVVFLESQEMKNYLNVTRLTMRAIGLYMTERFKQLGAKVLPPKGGFYQYPDFSDVLTPEIREKWGLKTSENLQDLLFEHQGISILPGIDFLREETEMGMRIAFTDLNGPKVIADFMPRLNDSKSETQREKILAEINGIEFLKNYAPSIVEVMDRFDEFFKNLKK